MCDEFGWSGRCSVFDGFVTQCAVLYSSTLGKSCLLLRAVCSAQFVQRVVLAICMCRSCVLRPGAQVAMCQSGRWGYGGEASDSNNTSSNRPTWDSHRGVFLMLQDPTATSLPRSTCWTSVDWTQLASNLPFVESDLVTWLVCGWQCPARFRQQSWWGTRFRQQSWWGTLLGR